MNYAEILATLGQASAIDLFCLRAAIDRVHVRDSAMKPTGKSGLSSAARPSSATRHRNQTLRRKWQSRWAPCRILSSGTNSRIDYACRLEDTRALPLSFLPL